MKVLFAIGTEKGANQIIDLYKSTYGEKIEATKVFFFRALLETLRKNKDFDRIVIHEELEPTGSKNQDAIDKYLFNNLDKVTDEAGRADIIIICTERRQQNDKFVKTLFNLGIYNVLTGQDRTVGKVSELINRPRTKKDAKMFIDADLTENPYDAVDAVDEMELRNIIKYYERNIFSEEKIVAGFDSLYEQYNFDKLKQIVPFLPERARDILQQKSSKYVALMSYTPGKGGRKHKDEPERVKVVEVPVYINRVEKIEEEKPEPKVVEPKVEQKSEKPKIEPKPQVEEPMVKPSVEEKKFEMPKVEVVEPKIVEPKVEAPKVERKVEIPRVKLEEPRIEETKPEVPKVEKKFEVPKVEIVEPKEIESNVEIPKVEPKVEVPHVKLEEKVEEPKVEMPKVEVAKPKVEESKVEMPKVEVAKPKVEEPKVETPKVEVAKPKVEEPKVEMPKVEVVEPKVEEPKVETPKVEVAKPKVEEPKVEMPKVEVVEPKVIEPKVEMPKVEPRVTQPRVETVEPKIVRPTIPTPEPPQAPRYQPPTRMPSVEPQIQTVTQVIEKEVIREAYEAPRDYKKAVAFIGAHKTGSTFLITAVATALANKGVKVAILDLTKNKDTYTIFTGDDGEERDIAGNSLSNLVIGQNRPLKAGNISVYTGIPRTDRVPKFDVYKVIETAKRENSVVLIDCDFVTSQEVFRYVQTIYVVQDMDILNVLPITMFLKELKSNEIDLTKVAVIVNKHMKMSISATKLIEMLTFYVNPEVSVFEELLPKNMRRFIVPFDEQNYLRYMENLCSRKMNFSGFSDEFKQAVAIIVQDVFPIGGSRMSHRQQGNDDSFIKSIFRKR